MQANRKTFGAKTVAVTMLLLALATLVVSPFSGKTS